MTSLGKSAMLEALHGENWKSTVILVRQWSAKGSAIFLRPTEREQIIVSEKTFWISGTFDQPYPPHEITRWIDSKEGLSRCLQVPCDHFNYFSSGWEYTAAALKLVLGRAYPKNPPTQLSPPKKSKL